MADIPSEDELDKIIFRQFKAKLLFDPAFKGRSEEILALIRASAREIRYLLVKDTPPEVKPETVPEKTYHCFKCGKDVTLFYWHEYFQICKRCLDVSQGRRVN